MRQLDTRKLSEALRRLILLALCRQDGAIEDTEATRILREFCSLGANEVASSVIVRVVHALERSKIVDSWQAEDGSLQRVALAARPTEAMQAALEQAEEENKSCVSTASTEQLWLCENDSPHALLVARCLKGYQALQAIAAISDYNIDGQVVLNVRGAMLAVGIDKVQAKEVKYYLRMLGLAESGDAFEELDAVLWWWRVSTDPLPVEKLMQLITGPDAFELIHPR